MTNVAILGRYRGVALCEAEGRRSKKGRSLYKERVVLPHIDNRHT